MIEQAELTRRARVALALTKAVLDPASDIEHLESLVLAATAATGAANGAVNMLTDEQVNAVLAGGVTEATTPGDTQALEDTICVNALRSGETLVIPDTGSDARVSSLPQVTGGAVGAYLGSPLRTSDNEVVGVLCLWDADPRVWSAHHIAEAERIAGLVTAELDRVEVESR